MSLSARLAIAKPVSVQVTLDSMRGELAIPLSRHGLTYVGFRDGRRPDAIEGGLREVFELSDGSTLTLEEPFTQKTQSPGYPPIEYAGLASLDNASPPYAVIRQEGDVAKYVTHVLSRPRYTVASSSSRPVFFKKV
jgi:hypothetical protein